LPDRREEVLARASAATFKLRVRPRTVGHHPNNPPRPKCFYVQLDKNDLYMLIIPKEFNAYVKGRPYRQLVSIKCCKDCEWIVYANPYRDEVVLDRMWPTLVASLDLKVGDYLLFKVTANGFKLRINDRITSCQRSFICSEHADLY
jgi:hypothetical protein